MKNLLIVTSLLIGFTISTKGQSSDFTKHVDPFIGSGGLGNTFPGVSMPFGMVKLGPDDIKKASNKGYSIDGEIDGFSHTHVSGTGGAPKYGNILVSPVQGNVNLTNRASSRSSEEAKIGYFSMTLAKHEVKAELAASHSVGFHKYSFTGKDTAFVMIDVGEFLGIPGATPETQELVGCEIRIVSDTSIEGYTRVRNGWNRGDAYTVYFSAVFDQPADFYGAWKNKEIHINKKVIWDSGEPAGAYFGYSPKTNGQVIQLKVGISFLGINKARQNLKEIPHWSLNTVVDEAKKEWNDILQKFEITEMTKEQKRTFYTAVYHSYLMPVDRTGENPKWNSGKPYYDDFYAIWDTYRTVHPLYTLLTPQRQSEIITAMIDIYKYDGYMPEGRSGNHNGRVQGGTNSDIMIADAMVKGLENIDYKMGYEAMKKNAEIPPGGDEREEGRGGIMEYKKLGYVPYRREVPNNIWYEFEPFVYERAGTRTVEYAHCDHALATVAKNLNFKSEHEKYKKRASNWKNIWRPVEYHGIKGFIWPKKENGEWLEDPDHSVLRGGGWGNFIYESGSWDYSFHVPHDLKSLIKACGGLEAFEVRLDTFFTGGYFTIGNEPGFLVPCYYNYIAKPYRTAKLVRQIMAQDFSDTRNGLPGNDDAGTTSAWYVFHSLGFYPNAGQDVYLIAAPQYEKIIIHLENGKDFIVTAKNVSDKNIYIQKAKLNGKTLKNNWFRHTDIKDGGTLEFVMGSKPSDWSVDGELPPSMSTEWE